MVGMVKADLDEPKLVMNDAIKRIGLLPQQFEICARDQRGGRTKNYLAACDSKPTILAARLLRSLHLRLLKFFCQIGFFQTFKVLDDGLVLRVARRFNVRQKVNELPTLLR
jgi:hypothetical protein